MSAFPASISIAQQTSCTGRDLHCVGEGGATATAIFFLPKNKVPKSEDEKTKSLSISAPPGASCYHRGHLPGAEFS